MSWVQIPLIARCTTLFDKVCQWLAFGRWFSPVIPVSSYKKICHHDITEILLKVALKTIKPTNQSDILNIKHYHMYNSNKKEKWLKIYNPTAFRKFEFHSWRGVLDKTLFNKLCQWLVTSRWFSPYTPVSSTNKTCRHDIAEILLKVALNTITLTPNPAI